MYLSCRIFGRVCYTDLPLTTGLAGWAGWWSRGAPDWEREQETKREREENTPASTKSNSKRYKIVAAAVTDTRYDDDDNDVQFCFVFNYRNNNSYSYNTLLYFIDNVVESIEYLPVDEKHDAVARGYYYVIQRSFNVYTQTLLCNNMYIYYVWYNNMYCCIEWRRRRRVNEFDGIVKK